MVLNKLRPFILPGGTPVAAQLHGGRPRWALHLLGAGGDIVNPLTVKYLNRLSDLLFILSQVVSIDSHGAWATSCGCPVAARRARLPNGAAARPRQPQEEVMTGETAG
ncbi:ATP:cob(I)alamin adenosyltransferase [Micromonospora fulviviridis]|uniref:ATP:cob(I)alamin adenosyltransferase n=1 Tax=Micromonospora fulviviridis TaxID=47860 RepID=A0ABV2VW99_9ACTN